MICPKCKGSGEMTALVGSGPDASETDVACAFCEGSGEVNTLRSYWDEVRKEWRSDGKARALAWLTAAGILVGLAMFVALAHAINAVGPT